MSEEILKALMQLYAIITPKAASSIPGAERVFVEKFLKTHINNSEIPSYLELFDSFTHQKNQFLNTDAKIRGASVIESVKVLSICKRINETLTREQKYIVLVRLMEYAKGYHVMTGSVKDIIYTVSEVFQVSTEDFERIYEFVYALENEKIKSANICILSSNNTQQASKHICLQELHGQIRVLKMNELDVFFIQYLGQDEVFLNGLPLVPGEVSLFSRGAILKLPKDGHFYYSNIASIYSQEGQQKKMLFEALDVEYEFSSNQKAIHSVSITAHQGEMIAFMGASGAGKSTLLNILSGLMPPHKGYIKINGVDIYAESSRIRGGIGYIPQDDLLLEELTVFENLYYSAQLCSAHLTKDQQIMRVNQVLEDLGLKAVKDIKVGSPLNKKISGGQRKRLNIALELVREADILFVDEPTSGLSSRDSENVIDLLKELSKQGKIVFVVIHQPSSDIYKVFDKLLLLDVGGYPIYYGNPVEAVLYFKRETQQLNSKEGECVSCGNVNPEIIFSLIEARVVNERGEFMEKRKIEPIAWNQKYESQKSPEAPKKIAAGESIQPLAYSLGVPNVFRQWLIFLSRDLKAKWSNKQYVLINFLEGPVLGLILSFIIKYMDPKEGVYVFGLNKNIPAFLFMSVIVALFMSLTLSAEEIIRDKKILKREALLSLSWNSYLFSKIYILFFITLVQTGMFLFVGKWVLEYSDLFLRQWALLFSVGAGGVLLGLLISSVFNSAVTIYILIPILLIPQMILSGAIFKFDELNSYFGHGQKVPLVADAMFARWGYEGLMVDAFTHNQYNKHFYALDQQINELNYVNSYYIPKWVKILENQEFDSVALRRVIAKEKEKAYLTKPLTSLFQNLETSPFLFALDSISESLNKKMNELTLEKEMKISALILFYKGSEPFKRFKKQYHNKFVEEVVCNNQSLDYLVATGEEWIRKKDLIYEMPPQSNSYRTFFYAPRKWFLGTQRMETLYFNILYIWGINVLIFLMIRFKVIHKVFKIR